MALITTGTTYGSVFAPNVIGSNRVVSGAPVSTYAAPVSTYAAPVTTFGTTAPYVTSAPYMTSAPIITETIAAPQVVELAPPVLLETLSAPPATYLESQSMQQQGSAVPFPMGPLPAVACRVEGVGSAAAYNDLRQQRDASQQAFWSMRQQEAPETFQIAASSGSVGPIEEGFAVMGGFAGPTIIQSTPMQTFIGGATFAQPGFVETFAAPTMIEQFVEPGVVIDTFAAPTMVETFAAETVIA